MLRDRKTGSGPLRRTKSGRRNLRGRLGERILSFMVRFFAVLSVAGLSAFMLTTLPDDAHAARRKYKKEVDKLKPDLEAYNKQKEAAMGLAPGTLSQSESSTFSLTTFDPTQASSSQVTHSVSLVPLTNSESRIFRWSRLLTSNRSQQRVSTETRIVYYMPTTSLLTRQSTVSSARLIKSTSRDCMRPCFFADNHPLSIDKRRKFSRKRPNEDTGDITYINEKNRIFNKKVELLSLALAVAGFY